MTLYILDPGLNSNMGHHALVDKLIVEEAKKHTTVKLLGFVNIDEEVKKDLKAVEWFNFHTYMRGSDDPVSEWLETFSMGQEITFKDLSALHDVKANDTILVPSCNAWQLLAVARWAQQCFPLEACPRFVVRFGYDSGFYRDGTYSLDAGMYRFAARIISSEFQNKFQFCTWHEGHTWQMQEVIKRPVETWPDPITAVQGERQKNEVPVVGFIGHQRIARGALLLPGIVEKLRKSKCKVYIHTSGPQGDFEKEWAGLEVDRTAYTPDQYNQMLRGLDILVLPYIKAAYKYGPSGVLTEAITNGIPVLVPAKSALAEMAEKYGHFMHFRDCTPEAIALSIDLALQDLDTVKAQAMEGAARWNAVNGADKFIKKVLNV